MKLSKLLKNSTQNKQLLLLISQYDKQINEPYNKIFCNREANLNTLLSQDFHDIKEDVNKQILIIHNAIDDIDIDDIDETKLTNVKVHITEVIQYLEYLSNSKYGQNYTLKIDKGSFNGAHTSKNTLFYVRNDGSFF